MLDKRDDSLALQVATPPALLLHFEAGWADERVLHLHLQQANATQSATSVLGGMRSVQVPGTLHWPQRATINHSLQMPHVPCATALLC